MSASDETRDPSAVLRELWQSVESPAPHRTLGDEDGATRAAVDWTRRAYAEVAPEVAATAAPLAARRRAARRRWQRRAPALRLAAATLLCVFAGFAAARFGARPGAELEVSPPHGTPAVVPPGPSTQVDPVEGPPPEAPAGPAVLSTAPDRVVLRSGSVRLTLLQSDPDPLEES